MMMMMKTMRRRRVRRKKQEKIQQVYQGDNKGGPTNNEGDMKEEVYETIQEKGKTHDTLQT